MNKKLLTPILVLLGVGVALAAVSHIISNSLVMELSVESPIEAIFTEVSDRLTINGNTVSGTIYGGDTIWFKITSTNRANNPIERYPVFIVKSNQGISPGVLEIDRVIYQDPNGEWDVTNMLYCVDTSTGSLTQLRSCPGAEANEEVVIFFDNNGDGTAQPYEIGAGETTWFNVTVTLSPTVAPQELTVRYEEWFTLKP